MSIPGNQPFEFRDISTKVAQVLQTRTELALQHFSERVRRACDPKADGSMANPMLPWQVAASSVPYAVDFAQRSILFWDTLRQRGNNFVEHERQGLPPVLHFDYEIVMDGRSFKRPVNYALLRIVPPKGVTVDPKRRPYVIIDPRGGHGPGIGGFKDDSQVGVALHEGHPVYFVIFFPNPEPGQTLLDVCDAEREFVHRVRELHPDAAEAGNRRQLSGRLGSDDAGRCQSRRHRSDRDRRRADVLLGRRLERGRGRQSDALCRRAARRHLARVAHLRPRRGQVRRRRIWCRTSRT